MADSKQKIPCTFGPEGKLFVACLTAEKSGTCATCGWDKPAHFDYALRLKLTGDGTNPLEVEPNNVQKQAKVCKRYVLDLDAAHGTCENCGHAKQDH